MRCSSCTFALLLITAPTWLRGQSWVTSGNAVGTPGSTVNLPLNLTSQATSLASLQFTVVYSPGLISGLTITEGPEALRTSKQVSCNSGRSGRQICILAGMNATPLRSGVIANLSVTLSNGVGNGPVSIQLQDGVGATPSGDTTSLGTTGSVVNINADVPDIMAISCAPLLLTMGGTTQCTVTLSGASPVKGTTVNLGRGSSSAMNLLMPTSVAIPAGRASAAFTVQALGSLSSPASIVIVATLNGRARSATVTISLAESAVSVAVAPSLTGARPAQTRQFTATVTGTSNKAVAWAVMTPNGGTISSGGIYTAPVNIAAAQVVTVRATSVASPTKSATAIVILYPNVAMPAIGGVSVVTGTTNATITWTNTIPSSSAVVFGTSPGFLDRIATNSAPATAASITLNGLVPDTTYYYRAKAGNAANGNDMWPPINTAPASFRTARAPSALTIWPDNISPAIMDVPDSRPVELGLRFSSNVAGRVLGLRFYKGTQQNAGPHVGHLWDSGGQLLATVTFLKETGSGWQTMYFPQPVRITPGRLYVVSYHAPAGHYSATRDAFPTVVQRGVLRTPADAGTFRYGSGGFPTDVWNSSYYWVDAIVQPD